LRTRTLLFYLFKSDTNHDFIILNKRAFSLAFLFVIVCEKKGQRVGRKGIKMENEINFVKKNFSKRENIEVGEVDYYQMLYNESDDFYDVLCL
jgi:hypothetical protein